VIPGQGEGSKLKVPKTSGEGRTPVRHTIPLGIVIFLVFLKHILLISSGLSKIHIILQSLYVLLCQMMIHAEICFLQFFYIICGALAVCVLEKLFSRMLSSLVDPVESLITKIGD